MTSTDLATAFQTTRYLINEQRITVTVVIGLASAALDRLLDRYEARQGVFITAWNPASLKHDRARNLQGSAELATVIERSGHRFLPAINLADDREWTEESFFVLDISIEEALVLARAYGQKAVVLAERNRAARILWADPATPKEDANGLE